MRGLWTSDRDNTSQLTTPPCQPPTPRPPQGDSTSRDCGVGARLDSAPLGARLAGPVRVWETAAAGSRDELAEGMAV